MSIDAVLFDLDGTLCEYRRSSRELLDLAFAEAGVDPLFVVEDYFAAFDDFSGPGVTTDELRANCFAWLADERGHDPQLGREVAAAYAARRDHSEVDLLPGAVECLDALWGGSTTSG